jgi:CBS domain-containing protein
MKAMDVMTTAVVTVDPETKIDDIARRLIENRISAVPVVDGVGKLCGLVSEGDLMRRPESRTERHRSWWLEALTSPEELTRDYVKTHGLHARDVMTHPVITVPEDATVEEIASILEKHRIKRVPVLRNGKLVGIVSRANLLHGLIARKAGDVPTPDDRTLRNTVIKSIGEAGLDKTLVDVVVTGGTVHLWGMVETQSELDALRVASERIAGVKAVENDVRVMPSKMRGLMWS